MSRLRRGTKRYKSLCYRLTLCLCRVSLSVHRSGPRLCGITQSRCWIYAIEWYVAQAQERPYALTVDLGDCEDVGCLRAVLYGGESCALVGQLFNPPCRSSLLLLAALLQSFGITWMEMRSADTHESPRGLKRIQSHDLSFQTDRWKCSAICSELHAVRALRDLQVIVSLHATFSANVTQLQEKRLVSLLQQLKSLQDDLLGRCIGNMRYCRVKYIHEQVSGLQVELASVTVLSDTETRVLLD